MQDYTDADVEAILEKTKEEEWTGVEGLDDEVFGRGQEDMNYDDYVKKYTQLGVPWQAFLPGTFPDKEREFREKYELDKEEEFLDFADLAWDEEEEEEEDNQEK